MKTNRIDVAVKDDKTVGQAMPINFGVVDTVDTLPNLDTFILELTQNCNYRCTYCCYSGKYKDNRSHSNKTMSDETLLSAIKFIQANRVPDRKLNIVFYGGEPLLHFAKIKDFVRHATDILPDDTDYTISTNGSLLLTEGILEWCVVYDITLNISFDGYTHEAARLTADGRDSHDLVLYTLSQIYRLYPDYWRNKVNLLVTVSDIRNLRGIAELWASPSFLRIKAPYLISGVSPCHLTDYNLDEEDTLRVLRELMKYYFVNRDNIFIRTYFDLLCSPIIDRQIYSLPETVSPLMCLPFNTRCYIDADGKLGVCEKTSDNLRLGDIESGWNYDSINRAVIKMSDIRKTRCADCELFRFCKTCFTNFFHDEARWNADCEWQRKWSRIALIISLELLENGLVDSDEAVQCSLRTLTEDDIPSIYRIMSNPAIMRSVDGLETFTDIEDAERFYRLMSEYPSLYCIADSDSNMIGMVGIDDIYENEGNIFFILDQEHWGKGIMTGMLSEYLSKYVPETVMTITTYINPENEAALKVASKFSRIEISSLVSNN